MIYKDFRKSNVLSGRFEWLFEKVFTTNNFPTCFFNKNLYRKSRISKFALEPQSSSPSKPKPPSTHKSKRNLDPTSRKLDNKHINSCRCRRGALHINCPEN